MPLSSPLGANWDNSVVVGNMEDGSSVLRFIHHKLLSPQ